MDNITQNGLQGDSKFPGLSQEQIDRLEQVTANLTGIEKQQRQQALYQGVLQQINQDKINNDRMQAENELYYKSTQEKDQQQKNYLQSNVRQEQLADLVKQKRNLRADANTQDVINALMQEAQVKGVSVDSLNSYLAGESDDFIYDMGFAERPEESNIGKDIALAGAIGGAVAGVDATVRGVGKMVGKAGEKLYKSTIDPSIREAREIQRAGANLKDAKIAVQDAKAELKEAKKLGEGVEEAKSTLQEAEQNLKTVKAKKVNTVADTAMEYNVGEGLTEGRSAEDRGIQARSKANQIFKKTINPALEKSTSTINVQGLIDGLTEDIQELAKNDPDKLKAYEDALGSLKESYADSKFANYSLKDSQTLKSGLQGRTPQKFFKGNEITNELQELKGILSNKLKNSIHSTLTKELGTDTAKLYKDYANLTDYADNLASASTKGPSKGGFGGFMDRVANKADPIKQKAGLLLNKAGSTMAKTGIGGKQAVEGIGDAFNYIIKNGKKFLKGASKGMGMLKVADPNGLIDILREAPGTIGEIATDAGNYNPVTIVNDMLTSVAEVKDEWNDMGEQERMEKIKQDAAELGFKMSDEDAKKSYDLWKEKHPDGKYGFFDEIGDIQIIVNGKEPDPKLIEQMYRLKQTQENPESNGAIWA